VLPAVNEFGSELKWKTSRDNNWHSEVQKALLEQLVVGGEVFQLYVSTNNLSSDYVLSAMLWANGRPLQEGIFCQLDKMFSIELNQFYDTILNSRAEGTTLTVEIRKGGSEQLVGEVDVLRFG